MAGQVGLDDRTQFHELLQQALAGNLILFLQGHEVRPDPEIRQQFLRTLSVLEIVARPGVRAPRLSTNSAEAC